MQTINIIAVGNLKEKFFKDAAEEYKKRLGKYCKLNVLEVPEFNSDNIKTNIENEGREILSRLKGFVFALTIDGEQLSSEKFSEKIENIAINGISEISFVIGGSNGLSEDVKKKADFRLSFSNMTFPHQLFRIILLEQIYRAFNIITGTPYHK